MKTTSIHPRSFTIPKATLAVVLTFALCAAMPRALAYPPAPHHLIYGLVRDEYGTPFGNSEARIILQTTNGVQILGTVLDGLAFGVNYQIEIPMHSRRTVDTYSPTALTPATPFR